MSSFIFRYILVTKHYFALRLIPKNLLVGVSIIMFACCTPFQQKEKHAEGKNTSVSSAKRADMSPITPEPSDLARRLEDKGAVSFFNYMLRPDVVASFWSESNSRQNLENLVRDTSASPLARFLACEVLFDKEFLFIGSVGPEIIAPVYVHALQNNFTGFANTWGLLYEHDDTGPVGSNLVTLGADAVPALIPLLSDERVLLEYKGSEEAIVGNDYKFRIKDFAAYYLSKITRTPILYHEDYAARDQAIDALRATIQ